MFVMSATAKGYDGQGLGSVMYPVHTQRDDGKGESRNAAWAGHP